MASSRAVAFALALALAACTGGGGVDDLSLPSMPLVHVRGHVDLSAVHAAAGGHPLNAALVWGAVAHDNQACLKYPSNADLQKACPDPFGFVPGQVEVTAPVKQDGSFDLTLDHLPATGVSVGTDAARIAWGSVVVAADTDGNGTFDPLGGNNSPRGSTALLADQVVAASFSTLRQPQRRVGFLEGTWDAPLLGLFYPFLGCPKPAAGFSELATPGITLGVDAKGNPILAPLPGSCTDDPISRVVEATPLSIDEGKALVCRAMTNRTSIQQPPADVGSGGKLGGDGGRGGGPPVGPPGGPSGTPAPTPDKQVCLDPQTLAIIGAGDCPSIMIFPLVGCHDDLTCQKPDWDLRKSPPTWWPCH